MNNTYKLVSTSDGNKSEVLTSTTFQDAIDEALYKLQWYVMEDEDRFVAVSDVDSANVVELSEQVYEDAQYEAINQLGYFISSPL